MPILPTNLGEDCMESVLDEHELEVLGEYPRPHGGDEPLMACDEDISGHDVPSPAIDDRQSETRSGDASALTCERSDSTGAQDAFRCSGPLRDSVQEFEFADDLVGCTAFEAGRQHHRSLHAGAKQPVTARG